MTAKTWLLYGAYGYSGALILEEALRRGHRPILAGRSAEKLRPLAEARGLESRAFALDDPAEVRKGVDGAALVMHAAGPFVHTARPMIEACLEARASYADITGEIPVFRRTLAQDGRAKERGVALLSGAGFDVVPTDCLAAFVAGKVPAATSLELAFAALGRASRGTSLTALEAAPGGGAVRRGGELRPWTLGRGLKRIRFSDRERLALPIPWGDLETAYRTTGIPDITTYMAVPDGLARALWIAWPATAVWQPVLRRVLGSSLVQSRGRRAIEARGPGPTAEERARSKSLVWARAASRTGASAEAWLEAPEGYDFTALSAVRVVERLLAGGHVGALTPAGAFGADFVLEIPGTTRLERL